MANPGTNVVDHNNDRNGWLMHQVMNSHDATGTPLFALPDFVKTASASAVPSSSAHYGDPARRLFPCHTAADTWKSAVAFHVQKQAYDEGLRRTIEKRIHQAAKFHGIAKQADVVRQAAERYNREATIPDEDYALILRGPKGEISRHYPVRNGKEVLAACACLEQYKNELHYSDRVSMAQAILRKAAKFEVEVPDKEGLEKTAGWGTCSAQTAAEFVFSRARVLKGTKFASHGKSLAQLAMKCLNNPEFIHEPSNLQKLAMIVDNVDRQCGLDRAALPSADKLFQINLKVAARIESEHFETTSGNIYSKQAVSHVSLEQMRAVMGNDFASAVTNDGVYVDHAKLASIVATLPRGDAELFDRMCAQNGVHPAHQVSAHDRGGLSKSQMIELAAAHAP